MVYMPKIKQEDACQLAPNKKSTMQITWPIDVFHFAQLQIKLMEIIQLVDVYINAHKFPSHMLIIWQECVSQYATMLLKAGGLKIQQEYVLKSVQINHLEIISQDIVFGTAQIHILDILWIMFV